MKVAELIAQLQNLDPEMSVHFSYNYGDHWRTLVAPTVDNVEVEFVKYSDYHSMDKIVDLDDAYDEETQEPQEGLIQVVVIG
jgi:hypothetical protein